MYGLQVKCRGRDLQENFQNMTLKNKSCQIIHVLFTKVQWDQSLFEVKFAFFQIEGVLGHTPAPSMTRFPLALFPIMRIWAYVRASGGFPR